MVLHWIILFSLIQFLFHFTCKYRHFCVCSERKNIHTGRAKRPPLLGAKCPYILVFYPTFLPVGTLPQSCDYCSTEYFKLIHCNNLEMSVIFVINFNRMDKGTDRCKSDKLLGFFGNMTIRIMGKDVRMHRLKTCNQNIIHWKLLEKVTKKLQQIWNRIF